MAGEDKKNVEDFITTGNLPSLSHLNVLGKQPATRVFPTAVALEHGASEFPSSGRFLTSLLPYCMYLSTFIESQVTPISLRASRVFFL